MAEKTSGKNPSIYEYLNWRGDLTFDTVPLGEVDNLIFSAISYVDLSDVVSEDLAPQRPPVLLSVTKNYLHTQPKIVQRMGLIIPRQIVTLLVRAAKTPRFGLCRPFGYVNRICDEEQKQFCAVSFRLPTGDIFVSFRGTDDTIVGWKENFNMSFMHPVPAQTEALFYLESVASKTSGNIYVGGHSKGGNLAVFAAVKASRATRERIIAVYNNDGPGFDRKFIEGEDYKQMSSRIHTLVPQTSVIGMLLEHEENYTVVKSNSTGLLQHNGLSWEIMGGSFVHLDEVDEESKSIDRSLKAWLEELSAEERAQFVDSLYEAIVSTNAKTLTELSADKAKLLKAWNSMDATSRANLIKCVNLVFRNKNQKQKKTMETQEDE